MSKKGEENATPDIAKHQSGDVWEPVGAALAAPSLAEESAAFGTQAQDAVDGEHDGEEAALVEEDEEGEEDDGEEGDEDEDPFEEAAETFVSEGDTIPPLPPSTDLLHTGTSQAKAAMQIDSGGDASIM